MPRSVRYAVLLVALAILAGAAPPVPPAPTRWVTDTAGLMSATARDALDQRLEAYQKSTGHQVIVWIAPTLSGEVMEEWCPRVFTAWGIGRKGKDDGVAMFVFVNDKQLRIEVGYGLEERLPDLYVGRIIEQAIKPELIKGHGDVAIANGIDQILSRIGDDPASAGVAPLTEPHHGFGWFWITIFIILGIAVLAGAVTHPQLAWILFDIISSISNTGGGWGSGGGGGGFSGGGGRSGGGGASGHW
jgi:uncharacterized protein